MPYGTINADLMTTSNGVSSSGLYGFKNRIINGAMVIDQRNAGASVTITVNDTYVLDRWSAGMPSGGGSKMSVRQNAGSVANGGSVVAPAGFTNWLGVTSLSAYSVAAGDFFSVYQHIEGFNCADFAWGTASASTVTLSFRVYSSLTGTFGGALQNSDRSRSYPFTYTVSASNTWTSMSVTIPGDTSGTWLTTNGKGISVVFGLTVGSTYSGTAGAWASANYWSATGAVSVLGTNGATFYITGVQLEKGSTATSFDYRPYGTELQLCQRYYIKFVTDGDIYTFFASGATNSTTNAIVVGQFPVKMRSSPTISASNTRVYDTVSSYATTTIGTNRSSTTSISAEFTISGGTSGRPCFIGANANNAGYMDASSEL